MQFREFLAVIWKRRLIVTLLFVVCVGLATAFAFSQPKRYESTATIAFTPSPEQGQNYLPSDNLSALLSTYATIATSEQVKRRAEQINGGSLPGKVSTSTAAGSGVLDVIAKDTSPEGAAKTASATARAFIDSLDNNDLLVATIVNEPAPSSTPLQPRPPLIITLAAVLAAIAAILLALLLETFRATIDSTRDLSEVTETPVIGRIERNRSLHRARSPIVWEDPRFDRLQEEFRALRTNIELLLDEKASIIQVTSAEPGQGKSTIVANLGIAFSQLGIPTVIVDADLRRPRQHELFGVTNEVGVSTMLMVADADPGEVLQETDYEGLTVLPSGPALPNATEMLHVRFRHVIREIQASGALVLIDSPPVLPVSDARLIAPHVDGLLFVIAAHKTRAATVTAALEKLRFAQGRVIGTILNFTEDDEPGDTGYASTRVASGSVFVP